MQNYIEYVPATGAMQIGDEIWNFSNPTSSWGEPFSNSTVDENSLVGFGSIAYGLYFLTNTPSEYGPTIHIGYPFTLVLYLNITRGPCHTDSIPGTGVPSCTVDGSTVSTTEPVNEIFFNYSVWKTPSQPCPSGDVCRGQHVCPAVEPYPGIVCGEYDDIFFNSVNPATPHRGVPEHGPHGQIGSAAIEANGSAYGTVGLTNDFEFDYGIGSDDGDTNGVAYADGTVGVDYCPQAHTLPNGACARYSDTPAASDFGGETGETSIGEVGYWSPQSTPTGAGLLTGPGAPLAHLDTGPALLLGLWNMSGSAYPGGSGGAPLSYLRISPANAWLGVAAGAGVRDQANFQVAPTFGWYSVLEWLGRQPYTDRTRREALPPYRSLHDRGSPERIRSRPANRGPDECRSFPPHRPRAGPEHRSLHSPVGVQRFRPSEHFRERPQLRRRQRREPVSNRERPAGRGGSVRSEGVGLLVVFQPERLSLPGLVWRVHQLDDMCTRSRTPRRRSSSSTPPGSGRR